MNSKLFFLLVASILNVPIAMGDIIVLSSGEQLSVTVLEQNEATIKVHHEILGDFTINTDAITSIEISEVSTDQSKGDSQAVSSSVLKVSVPWNQSVNISLGLQNGQKNSTNFSTAYHADRTVDEHKVTIDIRYRMAESEGDRTANRFSSAWGNTWLQTDSKWDVFTNLQFDWSEFQSWDKRFIGDLGVGYELIKIENGDEAFTLIIRLGSGFRKEFNSGNEGLIPEGLLGARAQWAISNKQTLSAESTLYPDYADFTDYRLVTKATWNIDLDSVKNMQFSIGLLHEYDSVVDAGVERSNLHLTAGVKYDF